MKKKVCRSIGIIAVLIGVVVAIDACAPFTDWALRRDIAIVSDSISGTEPLSDEGAVVEKAPASAEVLLGTLSGSEREAFAYTDQVPEGFSEEVMSGDGFDEVLVSETGSVVGFVGEGSAAETFSRLTDQLKSKGWISIESEQKTMGTLVKNDGIYTWLMLACSSAGDRVSVVIQVE